MKRKAIQLAGRTLVVSLPNKWVREKNISKGDELDIELGKESVVISSQKEPALRSIKVDISETNYSVAWHCITSAYCKGYDEIDVVFSRQTLKDNRSNTIVRTADAVFKIVKDLIGMEVVKQGKNFCIVREVSRIQKEEFSGILRRLFFLIMSIAEDSAEAVKNRDKASLKNILSMEESVNRLSHYCLRSLKKFFGEEKKDYVFIIKALEMISDRHCLMLKKAGLNRKEQVMFKKLSELFRSFHKSFYSLSPASVGRFYEQMTEVKICVQSQKPENKYLILEILDLQMEILNTGLFLEKDVE